MTSRSIKRAFIAASVCGAALAAASSASAISVGGCTVNPINPTYNGTTVWGRATVSCPAGHQPIKVRVSTQTQVGVSTTDKWSGAYQFLTTGAVSVTDFGPGINWAGGTCNILFKTRVQAALNSSSSWTYSATGGPNCFQ